jgi:hypothetical protein
MRAFRRLQAAAVQLCLIAALFVGVPALSGATIAMAQDPSSVVSSELSSSELASSSEEPSSSKLSSSSEELSSSSSEERQADPQPSEGWLGWAAGIFAALAAALLGAWAMFYLVLSQKKSRKPSYTTEERKVFAATMIIAKTTGVFAVAGFVVLAALSLGFSTNFWSFLSYFGTDVFVGAAAGVVGGVAGFIFGIPRTREAVDQTAAGADGTPEKQKSKAALLANTNLERISDWLTTLLIGATLVQLNEIPGWLKSVGDAFAAGFKNEAVIPFVIVYFFGLAFLGIYLVTRLYLTAALKQTLGMIEGGSGGLDVAGARAKLENALASGNAAEQLRAIQYVDNAGLKPDQVGDLDFSLALARNLMSVLKAGNVDNDARRKQDLRTVVALIAKDADSAAELKDNLATGTYGSGDAALDTELAAALG